MFKRYVFSNDLKYRITRHLFYWIFVFLYFSLPYGLILDLVPFYLKVAIPHTLIDMFIVYFIIYYILPYFLEKKKYSQFFFIYLIILILNSYLKHTYYQFMEPKIFGVYLEKLKTTNESYANISEIINELYCATSHFFIVTLPAMFIVLFKGWHSTNQRIARLEEQSADHKIRLMRSQLHPHFLFNTLNNLYMLAMEKSDKVPEIIIKVSNILRYMLKEHNKKLVTFREELSIIYSYIELEKLRYGDFLIININNEIEERYYDILKGPPLVLFTFVENAFKHGPNKSIHKSWININIYYKNGIFNFITENSKEEGYKELLSNGNKKGFGLGLQNAKSTLYLFFQEKFHLDILNEVDNFKVILKINYNKK